jgi:hypothetical protein
MKRFLSTTQKIFQNPSTKPQVSIVEASKKFIFEADVISGNETNFFFKKRMNLT